MTTAARGLWLLVPLITLPAQAAELYRLDSANTRVSVNVRLFGLPWVSAHFDELSGDFIPDRQTAASRVDVTVRTASLDCENSWWNAKLLSTEWFDAPRYPQITYHSDHIRYDDHGGAVVSGQLTLHGVTRSVALIINRWYCSNAVGADDTCSFDAHTRIKRSDYGLPHHFWDGDEVDIFIRGVRAQAVAPQNAEAASP
jgi:polyisoprenoid-binding protein YceI